MDDKELEMSINPDTLSYLTYEQVARLLSVKRATVTTWVYLGKIKEHVRSGRKSLIPLAEVRRLLAEKTVFYKEKVMIPAEPPQEVPSSEIPVTEIPEPVSQVPDQVPDVGNVMPEAVNPSYNEAII